MSNIKSTNKVYITLSDLQLYANLNPEKKGIQKDLYSLKSKIFEDGSYDFSSEDVESLKNFTNPSCIFLCSSKPGYPIFFMYASSYEKCSFT